MDKLTQLMLPISAKLKGLLNRTKKAPAPPQPAQPAQVVSPPVSTTQAQTTAPPQLSVSKLPKIPKKLIIAALIFVIISVLAMVLLRMLGNGSNNIFPLPSASPSPTATPIVEVPSQYADDEDVKRIEENMKNLDKELNEAAFRDERLRIPTLDWEVEFDN